ncbi:MAG: hypothetical protein WBM86_30085 [Waterburya sp.]
MDWGEWVRRSPVANRAIAKKYHYEEWRSGDRPSTKSQQSNNIFLGNRIIAKETQNHC